MVNRLQAVNVMDFTGGLNLYSDAAMLLENEVPELLNMEPLARGGVRTRRGWQRWNPDPVPTTAWNPRAAYLHVSANGETCVLLANDTKLWCGDRGVFEQEGTVVADAKPHGADFVSWDDYVRIACGRDRPGVRYHPNSGALLNLTPSGGANWQNDYSQPGTGTNQPQAEIVAQHAGYLFVANTKEAGTYYPTRIRWSHPNNPNAWAQTDYADITEGGGYITSITPFSDRLLIFKSDSLWALFGYEAETWEFTNISRTIGAIHPQAITRSESTCWFLSWPQGVFAYTDRGVQEISLNIRPVFIDNQIIRASLDNVFLGWMNRRLWVSLPYLADGGATDATSAFVFDFEVGQGAWMQFRGADGLAPGPYMERPVSDLDVPMLAFSRAQKHAIQLDARENATDLVNGTGPQPFIPVIRTRWIDAGAPTHRKSWRRPDFLVTANQVETELQVQVFHNLDHVTPQRAFTVSFTPADTTPLWNHFNWNDGTVYRRGQPTTSIERGATMGRAGAIQVRTTTAPATSLGKSWGFDGIITKFIPRRFR